MSPDTMDIFLLVMAVITLVIPVIFVVAMWRLEKKHRNERPNTSSSGRYVQQDRTAR